MINCISLPVDRDRRSIAAVLPNGRVFNVIDAVADAYATLVGDGGRAYASVNVAKRFDVAGCVTKKLNEAKSNVT